MTEREILKYLVLFVLLVCFVLIPHSKYVRLGLSLFLAKTWFILYKRQELML